MTTASADSSKPADVPPLPSSTVLLALLAAAAGALGCLWVAWCEFPIYAWNEARLAPAFALRHGINPYPPLGGGPLSTWIYGPVGIFINLPATFAPTPLAALRSASVVNCVVIFAPLVVVFFGSRELRGRGMALPALALAVSALLVPRPNLILQVADHSAIAFGLLSCWSLTRTARPSRVALVLAAVSCALAVWAKQIALFLLLAQLTYLFASDGGRSMAIRYTAWVAFFGALLFVAFGTLFGYGNLWLNVVEIPGRLPWADDIGQRLLLRPWALLAQIALPAIGLFALQRSGHWPSRARESGRFFQLTALAFLAMLPIGLLSYVKIGGDTNLLHSWDYLLPGVLLVWLATERGTSAGRWRLILVIGLALALRGNDLTSLPARPYTAHLKIASELSRAHPRTLWFPRNPVINFYADGTLWHSEDGIETRFLAGYGLREPDFRRHLPPSLEGIVYPANVTAFFSLALLSEFDRQRTLPHWRLHYRAGSLASPPVDSP